MCGQADKERLTEAEWLQELYWSLQSNRLMRVTKLMRMSWTGHVARMQGGGKIGQELGELEVLGADGKIILK
jgi:hypothetical protein